MKPNKRVRDLYEEFTRRIVHTKEVSMATVDASYEGDRVTVEEDQCLEKGTCPVSYTGSDLVSSWKGMRSSVVVKTPLSPWTGLDPVSVLKWQQKELSWLYFLWGKGNCFRCLYSRVSKAVVTSVGVSLLHRRHVLLLRFCPSFGSCSLLISVYLGTTVVQRSRPETRSVLGRRVKTRDSMGSLNGYLRVETNSTNLNPKTVNVSFHRTNYIYTYFTFREWAHTERSKKGDPCSYLNYISLSFWNVDGTRDQSIQPKYLVGTCD